MDVIKETNLLNGEYRSPGGFVFGVQGWNPGEQRATTITFFLDGRVLLSDQYGKEIRGVVKNGQAVYFNKCSHAQVVDLLAEERIDWQTLVWAGWPQLPYVRLKEIKNLPPTPSEELQKIQNTQLRKDALRIRKEWDDAREAELQAATEKGE